MRTDVYFVVQDLTGCTNLYADGSAYLRYLVQRIRRLIRRNGDPPSDLTRALPPHERRAVHAYSWVLLCGTTACVTVAIFRQQRLISAVAQAHVPDVVAPCHLWDATMSGPTHQ